MIYGRETGCVVIRELLNKRRKVWWLVIATRPVVPIVTSALLPSRGWVRGSVRKNFVPPFMAGIVPGKPSNCT